MKMFGRWGLTMFLGVLSLGSRAVRAAVETEAICTSNSTFLYNSLNQSPCLVAAYLLSACTEGNWDLPALSSNNTGYQASTGNGTYVPCICTTVVYSLAAGCSICQLGLSVFSTWPGYSSECTTIYDRRLPMGIPAGTAVPAWAYQDVIAKGSFDITVVSGTTAPDSTVAVNGPTSSSSDTSTSTSFSSSSSSSFSSATGVPTATPSLSSKSSNAGAIAGGVVGGVVGLSVIGLLAFLLLRYQKKKRSDTGFSAQGPVAGIGGANTSSLGGYYGGGSPPMTQTLTPGYGSPSTPNSGASLLGGQKVYNPNDPSTYPSPVTSPYVMPATDNREYRGFPEV